MKQFIIFIFGLTVTISSVTANADENDWGSSPSSGFGSDDKSPSVFNSNDSGTGGNYTSAPSSDTNTSDTNSSGGFFSWNSGNSSQDQSDSTAGVASPNIVSSIFGGSSETPPSREAVNNTIGLLEGTSAHTSTSGLGFQQVIGVMATKSAVPLFIDLDGDGKSGGAMDFMLYHLLFGNDSSQYTTTTGTGVRSQFQKVTEDYSKEKVFENLRITTVILVSKLSDGRDRAPLKEVIEIALADQSSLADRNVTLASLATIAAINPVMTTDDGPILSQISTDLKDKAKSVRDYVLTAVRDINNFSGGGSRLALEATISRLALVAAIVDMSAAKFPRTMRVESVDALRAALYFMAFELKRLNISNKKRSEIMGQIVSNLAVTTPHALRLAAEKASDAVTLARIEALLITSPVLHTGTQRSAAMRWTLGTLAGTGIVLGWMAGGPWLIEHLTDNIAYQVIVDMIGQYVVPAAITVGLPQVLKSSREALTGRSGARNLYIQGCAKALGGSL